VDASPDGLAGKEATFSLCSFWYNVALLPGYSGVSLAYRRELRASADRWSTSASPAPWARWAGPALLAGSASVFQRWPDSHPPTCLASPSRVVDPCAPCDESMASQSSTFTRIARIVQTYRHWAVR